MVAPIRYAYAPATGEYVGPVAADPDPMEPGNWLFPAFCVEAVPPAGQGQAAVWMGDAWGLVPDHRGQTWHGESGPVIVDRLGDPAEFEPPLSAEAPPPEPTSVRAVYPAQAKIALYEHGYLDQVEALVAAHPYVPVRIWYASSSIWEIDHPYLGAIGAELGLDAAAIQALFDYAATR